MTLKGSEEVESVLTVAEPPPVNVSGLPLSRSQPRRYTITTSPQCWGSSKIR